MSGHRFDICEPSTRGQDGYIAMDGKRLNSVRSYTISAPAGELVTLTVTFIAASVNFASKETLAAMPYYEVSP